MPFTKHIIEPINISQCPLPPGEPNELECLSNLTLANVIRQLSSLGQHAGRIFDELSTDAVKLKNRTHLMHQRIENLKSKCNLLDIQSEEVTLADFQTKKQFKSSVKIDQQVVSRKTMPEAMRIMYNNADPPPALDKLNPFRTDGKDCMKFYTDPEFFFNIWCNELIKDNETRKIEKKQRKKTKNDKQPINVQQQNLKSPIIRNGVDTSNLQQKQQHQQYDDASYYQQQLLLLNQAKQQQQLISSNNPLLFNKHFQPSHLGYDDFDNQFMIPVQPNILQQTNNLNGLNLNNYEIYTDSHKLINNNNNNNNVNKNGSQRIVNSNGSKQNNINGNHDRPMLPPPPIPNNQISDLQQIQQQMIKKKLTDINIKQISGNNGIHHHHLDGDINHQQIEKSDSADLPPPPSPPTVFGHNIYHQNGNNNANNNLNFIKQQHLSQQMNKLILTEKQIDSSEFDMPLPPPPIDLVNDYNQNQISPPLPPPLIMNNINGNNNNNGNNGSLPPPPPLPPLVESDTASSSSSISINNNSNQTKTNSSVNDEIKSARNCYLDDINKRRFQLKSTQQKDANSLADESRIKENNNNNNNNNPNNDTIQPFVNNSDVAAIIDFIRKFRPHVRDSSDDDEENSDWDE